MLHLSKGQDFSVFNTSKKNQWKQSSKKWSNQKKIKELHYGLGGIEEKKKIF